MKKNFSLTAPNKKPDRQIEAVKHEIKKYIARERRKPIPTGVDFWDFDCKFGTDVTNAEVIHIAEINKKIDAIVETKAPSFYIEILVKHGKRSKKSIRDNMNGSDE